MPHIERIYQKYRDQGFAAVAIEANGDDKNALKYLAENRFSFPFLKGTREMVQEDYGVLAVPVSYLIDRDGSVVERYVGYSPGDENRFDEAIKFLLDK